MRWQNRSRGMISPGEFIPLAESSGMIHDMGLWAFEHACRKVVSWAQQLQGTTVEYISVNVSVGQLVRHSLVEDFRRILEVTGADPRALVLEITESVIMQDAREMIRKLEGLRALGLKLSLDDFGTGYSSLSYLQQLPLDGLKIDKVFVQCLAPGSRELDIVGMVVQLGHRLGFKVTAEGIETAEQLRQCQLLGVDYGQGYYLGRPMLEHLAEQRVLEARQGGRAHPLSAAQEWSPLLQQAC